MWKVVPAAALVSVVALGASAPAADLAPGMTVDQTTADAAKPLLPPEIYAHYSKGEYINKVVDYPDSAFQ